MTDYRTAAYSLLHIQVNGLCLPVCIFKANTLLKLTKILCPCHQIKRNNNRTYMCVAQCYKCIKTIVWHYRLLQKTC